MGSSNDSPYDAFFYYRRNNLNAVRSGKWKLHVDEDLLFDLSTDVGETVNVREDYPEVVRELEELAHTCREDLGDERLNIEGRNCRPVGRVENSVELTSLDWRHPYMQAAYD